MKRPLFIIAPCLLALAAAGCGKFSPNADDAARTAVGHYVDGYNSLIDKIGGSVIKTYFRAVPESGPTEMSKNLLFPEQNFVSRDLSEAKKSFADAKAASPASLERLAGLADEFLDACQAVTDTYAEAQKYYAAENYKDDQGARGKELHQKMLQETDRYREAVAKFDAALDEIEDQQLAEELKQHEGNKNESYWFRKMLSETKRLLTTVEGAENPGELEPAFARAEQANTEFAKFVADKGGKAKLPQVFQSFVDQTDNFFVVATRLRRECRSEKPDGAKIDSDKEALVTAYNVVVQLGNALYEVEPYGQLN
jgi:tetratricopeptide (TPR) repeat protein